MRFTVDLYFVLVQIPAYTWRLVHVPILLSPSIIIWYCSACFMKWYVLSVVQVLSYLHDDVYNQNFVYNSETIFTLDWNDYRSIIMSLLVRHVGLPIWWQLACLLSVCLSDVSLPDWCQFACLMSVCLSGVSLSIWCQLAFLIPACLSDVSLPVWCQFACLVSVCLSDVSLPVCCQFACLMSAFPGDDMQPLISVCVRPIIDYPSLVGLPLCSLGTFWCVLSKIHFLWGFLHSWLQSALICYTFMELYQCNMVIMDTFLSDFNLSCYRVDI